MLKPCQGSEDTDFLPFLMGGQAGGWAESGAGGWRARPCPAGWDLHGPAPGDGSDHAATPTTIASGQGSHRLQAQKSCSVSALSSVPVGPVPLLRARSAHTPWPCHEGLLSAPRTLPTLCRHRRAEQGLRARRRAVSPRLTAALHGTLRPLCGRGNGPGEGRPVGGSALGPGLEVRLPSLHSLPPTSHPCPVPTHMAHTPWLSEGHVGLSGSVQWKA